MGIFQIIILIAATLWYYAYMFLIFHEKFRASSWFMIFGLVSGLITSFMWVYASSMFKDNGKLFMYSLAWDIMITVVSIAVPIMHYSVRFNSVSWIGIVLILAGVMVLKIANV